jgi:hypothetical protein
MVSQLKMSHIEPKLSDRVFSLFWLHPVSIIEAADRNTDTILLKILASCIALIALLFFGIR